LHDNKGRRQPPMPLASTNPTLITAAHKDRKLVRLADFFSSLLEHFPVRLNREGIPVRSIS
ncbi:MAG: hypothetical protein KDJ72_11110, partial [Methyloceanibacter sp.]|uniref:hypothetical protein n=1 Tax=Methyloceanibacter sp. TaxID=1965321 RepID=UPI001E14B6E5